MRHKTKTTSWLRQKVYNTGARILMLCKQQIKLQTAIKTMLLLGLYQTVLLHKHNIWINTVENDV